MKLYRTVIIVLIVFPSLFIWQVQAQRPPAPDPATIVSNVPDSPAIPIPRTAPEMRIPLSPPPIELMVVSPKPPVEIAPIADIIPDPGT